MDRNEENIEVTEGLNQNENPAAIQNEYENQDNNYHIFKKDLNPHKKEIIDKITKDKKRILEASHCYVFVAIVNIIIGIISVFSPDTVKSVIQVEYGYAYIIIGVLYMGVAGGVALKSRICSIIGFSVFAFDAVITLKNFTRMSTGLYLKGAIIYISIMGIISVFRYHNTKKKYRDDLDTDISSLFLKKKFKLNPLFIISSLITIGGIAVIIYCLTNLNFGMITGKEIAKWDTYELEGITVPIPADAESSLVSEDTYYVESRREDAEVILVGYLNCITSDFTETDKEEFFQYILDEITGDVDYESKLESGEMNGYPYIQVFINLDNTACAVRMIFVEDDAFISNFNIVGNVKEEKVRNALTSYFDYIEINGVSSGI